MGRVEKAAWVSIGVSLLLVALKYAMARISGSVALAADTWHSISDVAASVLVLAGAWINRKSWRFAAIIENVIALMISGMIFSAAYVLVKKSLSVPADQTIAMLPVVLIGTVVSASISFLIGQYELSVGRQENSPSLIAGGHHSIMDVYTTAVVAVGLLGYMIGLRLDTIAAIVVVLFVAEVGIEVAVLAVKGLARQQAFSAHAQTESIRRLAHLFGRLLRHSIRVATGATTPITAPALWDWWGRNKRRITVRLAIFLVFAYLLSGFYTVSPHQSALVTLFGKAMNQQSGPGLHYAPPRPIARVYKVEARLVQRMEVGFRSLNPDTPVEGPVSRAAYEWHSLHLSGKYKKVPDEAIMLTGDENLIDLNAVVHYSVSDPAAYLFGFTDQTELLRALTEHALRSLAAVATIDSLLTGSRKELETDATQKLQGAVDSLKLGVFIESIELQDVHPPVDVVRAFRDVASAKEKKVLSINRALAEQNERIPEARAQAEKQLTEADGYTISKVFHAEGEGTRFGMLATQYSNAQDVTAFRLYVEAMEQALTGKRKFIVSPDMEPGALDLRIFARGQSAAPKQPVKEPQPE